MTAPQLLKLDRIEKCFGAVRALRGVSMEVVPGEIHALLGENGAGKSTLIKVIAGAHEPDSGTVMIDGTIVTSFSPREARSRGVAVIYQQPALFPDLSVAENFALTLEPARIFSRIRHQARHETARRLLEKVGAKIDPEAEVSRLTMPEQQLVEIARALGAGARLLILDEPTSSLTPHETDLLFNLLKTLRKEGTACIYISHRLEEIARIADRVTLLRDGSSVGTFPSGTLSQADLIRLMVGREMESLFPRTAGPSDKTLVEVDRLNCAEEGIENISFQIRAGEILGLSGLIGAGRTELARVLFGLSKADSGTIRIGGRTVQIRSPREAIDAGIGYVPEDRRHHGVIGELSIAQNLSLASHPILFPNGWLREEAERVEAEKWIRELAVKCPGPESECQTLSGGNQQKIAVGRWLCTAPKFLIIDEPTQGVDVGAKAEIHRLLRDLANKGIAVLLISSDLNEVIGMCDRVGVMREGRIVRFFNRDESAPDALLAAAIPEQLSA